MPVAPHVPGHAASPATPRDPRLAESPRSGTFWVPNRKLKLVCARAPGDAALAFQFLLSPVREFPNNKSAGPAGSAPVQAIPPHLPRVWFKDAFAQAAFTHAK